MAAIAPSVISLHDSIPIKKEQKGQKDTGSPFLHVTLLLERKIFSEVRNRLYIISHGPDWGLHITSSPIMGKGVRAFHYDSFLGPDEL